jgi:DNA-binding CsgD family transcriptional regulator
MSAGPLIGREPELRRVEEFLDAMRTGPVALVLEGEIGIGKTVLWRQGLSAAGARGHRVLSCRPIDAEAQLAYVALGDLLAEVPEAVLRELPAPQRRAVEVALLRAEPEEGQLVPRAVPLGLLGVLRALARQGPTLVGIDDVQWLDGPSERALAFAARRLTDERIGLLVVQRVEGEGGSGIPLDLERALPEGRLGRLPVGSLAVAELDRLLEARLDAVVSRRTLARLHRMSGGNPFFALEIACAILRDGDPDAPASEPPIPPSLQQLVHDRLALLAPPAREAAQVVAALTRPTVTLVEQAMGGHEAVAAAAAAGVVEIDGERVRFPHPLLGSVAYAQLSPAGKRALHARLAAALDDPEERGRHLALAAARPDAAVAAALDEAARRARARGAPDAAAELWEQARRLSPADAGDEARRRGIEAAERYFEAGEVERARVLLEEVVAGAPAGRVRALALARLGWVRAHLEGFHAGAETFRAALAEPADDAALRVEIEEGLAFCLHSTTGVAAAEVHARTALEVAEALGDPALLAGALSHVAFLESLRGRGIAMAMIERAVGLGHPPEWSQILGRPDWIHALLLQWAGALEASCERFEGLYRDAVDHGEEQSLPSILFQLARVELLSGAWDRALRHAGECHETTLHSGQAGERPYSLTIQALVEAHLGRVEPALAKIDQGLALAGELGVKPAGYELLAVRGFLELSLGDADRADRHLGELSALVEAAGMHEPALFRFHGDAIEAKVALGRRAEAQALLAELERLGAVLERIWVLAIAGRCRGLLAAARGDLDGAYAALEAALGFHEHLGEPFERARTLLVLGGVQRRDRKKRPARQSLGSALETFDRLGATLWAARARGELARVGGRAPASGLTPTEERIAALIASGHTYREAADALFISPKTVQWNLSKVYRKLGVRSRSELAARFPTDRGDQGREDDPGPPERPGPGGRRG